MGGNAALIIPRSGLAALGFATLICFVTTLAQAAGITFINVPASGDGHALIGTVWYPCAAPPERVNLRGLAIPGVKDCPIAGDNLPLVVVSHGRTGWSGGHHDTAAVLADAGFVVAAINHPADSAFDSSRVEHPSFMTERPADIGRLVDFILGAWPDASKIDRGRIGFFGFSRGGYTGLIASGGRPSWASIVEFCKRSTNPICVKILEPETPKPEFRNEPRIKAAVIADPGPTYLFDKDSLKTVTIPIQLWASEHGGGGVTADSVATVNRDLPAQADFRIVQKAAHWAFLAPCSPAQTESSPRFCIDAAGFDRVEFHRQFNADVLAFFRRHL